MKFALILWLALPIGSAFGKTVLSHLALLGTYDAEMRYVPLADRTSGGVHAYVVRKTPYFVRMVIDYKRGHLTLVEEFFDTRGDDFHKDVFTIDFSGNPPLFARTVQLLASVPADKVWHFEIDRADAEVASEELQDGYIWWSKRTLSGAAAERVRLASVAKDSITDLPEIEKFNLSRERWPYDDKDYSCVVDSLPLVELEGPNSVPQLVPFHSELARLKQFHSFKGVERIQFLAQPKDYLGDGVRVKSIDLVDGTNLSIAYDYMDTGHVQIPFDSPNQAAVAMDILKYAGLHEFEYLVDDANPGDLEMLIEGRMTYTLKFLAQEAMREGYRPLVSIPQGDGTALGHNLKILGAMFESLLGVHDSKPLGKVLRETWTCSNSFGWT